jgi:RNA polymerase sigma factor (sigma-70 family)
MSHSLPPTLARVLGEMTAAVRRDVTLGPALLTQFAETRDEDSFRSLVRFYGPLVWTVCQRCLRDPNDADDAFQATFIVLARRAAHISPPERVSVWLHGVAFRAARKIREKTIRRREISQTEFPEQGIEVDFPSSDLRGVLDEELARLPEELRQAFVCCMVEGRTHAETAHLLGCAKRTVGYRVTKATDLLKARLKKRGLAPAGVLAGLAAPRPGIAPVGLVERAAQAAFRGPSKAAAATAAAVIRSMGGAVPWRYLAFALFLLVGAGGGIAISHCLAAPVPDVPSSNRSNAAGNPALLVDPAGVVVSGQVLDAANKPVRRIRVALLSRPPASANDPLPGDELVCKCETDAQGRYRLEGVPPFGQRLQVVAWGEGYAISAQGISFSAQTRTIERDIRLSQRPEIWGQVQGSQATPAREWRVEVIQLGTLRKPRSPLNLPGKPQTDDLFWPKELTVANGERLVLSGLDPSMGIHLRITGPQGSQVVALEEEGKRGRRTSGKTDLKTQEIRQRHKDTDPNSPFTFRVDVRDIKAARQRADTEKPTP